MPSTREKVYRILNPQEGDRFGRSLETFIILLIGLNVIMVILETEEEATEPFRMWFVGFEFFSSVFFTIEYVLRMWTCIHNPRFAHPVKGRIRYGFTWMAIVDILAILPFYLPMFIELDLRFVRAIRLFRLFRLFKVGRYASSISGLTGVFSAKKEELAITVFAMTIMLIMASSLMYFVESEAQPEQFSSIPAAMWWGVATLTTVGYGDVYPITPLGKFMGAIIALLGVGIVALPAGIIASGFNENLAKRAKEKADAERQRRIAAGETMDDTIAPRYCHHCGGDLHKPPARRQVTQPEEGT